MSEIQKQSLPEDLTTEKRSSVEAALELAESAGFLYRLACVGNEAASRPRAAALIFRRNEAASVTPYGGLLQGSLERKSLRGSTQFRLDSL